MTISADNRFTPEELSVVHAWILDLYTTTAPQTKYLLFGKSSQGYCCLGRLCVVTEEETDLAEHGRPAVSVHPRTYTVFKKLSTHIFDMTTDGHVSVGWTDMNDSLSLRFPEIADIALAMLVEYEYPTP